MKSTQQREIIRFDPTLPIEEAVTPSYTWYTDPNILESEYKEIFEKSWLPLGRLDQVRNIGDYFTGNIVGNPFLVVKDEENNLRGWHNVCRHHAAEIAKETGNCKELVCPYHGWTYRLDGSLCKAPRVGRQDRFKTEHYGLKPVSVDTWGPFVFVDLDGPWGGENNPRNLQKDLEHIIQPLEEMGISNMKWVERRQYEINCNWKLFVENSLDGGYHVAYAHERLASGLEFKGYKTEIHDRSVIQICDTNSQDERLGEKVIYAWLFPNFFINRYGKMMDTNLVLPLSHDKCLVIFDFYFDYDNLEEWKVKKTIRKCIGESDAVQKEDIEVCESCQRGMMSMSYEHGIYSSTLEQAVHHFHKLVWKELLRRGV